MNWNRLEDKEHRHLPYVFEKIDERIQIRVEYYPYSDTWDVVEQKETDTRRLIENYDTKEEAKQRVDKIVGIREEKEPVEVES